MRKTIFFISFLLLIWQSFTLNYINISDYKSYLTWLNYKVKSLDTKKINYIDNKINYLESKNCSYWQNKWFFYISPICFFKWEIPKLPFTQAVDISWPYIKGFDNIYDLKSINFYYTSAKPILAFTPESISIFFNKSIENKILSFVLYHKKIYVKIPVEYIALYQLKNYSFYVSDKDLSKRNKSRLHNFNIAINTLDNYLLKAGDTIYFNKLLANAKGYVGKTKDKKLLFYGGVCGASTLLFRNALINPYLYVTERYNHSQRYVNFYSTYIYWDDSSVYERDKRLKIKNISKYPIYFKNKLIDNKIYLVSIVPVKVNDFVYIEKKQIWKLKAYLLSNTYDQKWNLKYHQEWISKYNRRNYEK